MDGTTVELVLAQLGAHADRPATTVDDDGPRVTLSHRDLLDRVHREARRLDGLGVRRGDVVAIMTGNDPAGIVLRWAAGVVGATFVAVPDGHAAPALAELLATFRVSLLATTGARLGPAREAAERAGGVAVVDVERDVPDDATPVPVRIRPGDLASISLTGGTTGVPKGVPRRADLPGRLTPSALAGWHDVVQLVCTPVAHIAGTVALTVLMAGGHVVLQPGFDAGRALAAIPRYRVTTIQLLPRLLHALLDHPGLPGTDTSSLHTVRIGSAPASATRIGDALDRLGPVVGQTYGSIEATNICSISAAELADPALRGTVGRPVPGVEVSIRDDDGAELPVGATGEVWVRSDAVMPGYVNAPRETAAVLRDGRLRTGDLGHLDDAGYLTLVGRGKDVIFAEDANIHPAEVEGCLLAHPDVAGACVFAVTDADGSESAGAAVVARPDRSPTAAELIGWVAGNRGPAVAPSDVYLVADLPATPSGKTDRDAVRRAVTGARR